MADLQRRTERGIVHPFERQLSRLFGDWFGEGSPVRARDYDWVPFMDVSETDDHVLVKAEIPGVDPKDVDITLQGDTLILKGEKKNEKEEKEENYHHIERTYGSFVRSVVLPTPVEPDKVSADCKNGIITIKLPKKEEVKARTIKVNVK